MGAIRFDDVHFRYPHTVGDEALAGVDLDIAAGETVALVGETGAGKSTIVKLIARFYDPTAGQVAPVKFSVVGDQGLDLIVSGSPTWTPICARPSATSTTAWASRSS